MSEAREMVKSGWGVKDAAAFEKMLRGKMFNNSSLKSLLKPAGLVTVGYNKAQLVSACQREAGKSHNFLVALAERYLKIRETYDWYLDALMAGASVDSDSTPTPESIRVVVAAELADKRIGYVEKDIAIWNAATGS